jgi:hypothetical protein
LLEPSSTGSAASSRAAATGASGMGSATRTSSRFATLRAVFKRVVYAYLKKCLAPVAYVV